MILHYGGQVGSTRASTNMATAAMLQMGFATSFVISATVLKFEIANIAGVKEDQPE